MHLALNLLTAKKGLSSSVEIKIELDGLGERTLYTNNPASAITRLKWYKAGTTRYCYNEHFTSTDLLANIDNVSVKWASRFLKSIFEASINESLLQDIQALNC